MRTNYLLIILALTAIFLFSSCYPVMPILHITSFETPFEPGTLTEAHCKRYHHPEAAAEGVSAMFDDNWMPTSTMINNEKQIIICYLREIKTTTVETNTIRTKTINKMY